MRRIWLTTTAAALCAAATSSQPAAASPAGTLGVRPVASKSSDSSWTQKLKFWDKDTATTAPAVPKVAQAPVAKPTDTISPWKHPITYFSAAMSETPIASSLKRDSSATSAPKPADKLSLDTPIGPATPQFYISTSQVSERQGNAAQARTQLQQGLAKWPKDVELLRAAARLEDRQGNLPLAESLYHRAATANPQHAGALNDLGLCLARQGKLDQSVQAIEQAINLQPDKALYRNNAATVLVEMHQDQRALAHLSAVHGPAESNYNLGQLLADRGRPHEAVAYYQRALELDPTMEPAQVAIAQIRGEPMGPTQVASEPAMQQQDITPTYGPQLVPQQPVAEPAFPATARGPAFGTSSYVPPTGYYPAAAAPTYPPSTPLYQTAAAPVYQVPAQPQYQAPVYQVQAPVPPAYQAPSTPVYETANAPRYLPPVRPITQGSMVR